MRLAFLIDVDQEDSHSILDAFFHYSYSIWGGRFSLIVPCKNGAPVSAFLPWLKKYDPDLIYSYVDLSVEKQSEFHETFYPSALQHHWFGRDNDDVYYPPKPTISPLTVATLISLASTPSIFDGTRGVRIIGAIDPSQSDRFISDSFGFPSSEFRYSMFRVHADSGSMLLVVADDEFQSRRLGAEATVVDANALLSNMATEKRVIGLSQLSAMRTPRFDFSPSRWGDFFNLVVGDTVLDRLLYWNACALMPPWRDGDNVDLCVPRANFNDPAFTKSLREYLDRRNHVNPNSGGGSSFVTIRSISLKLDELKVLADELKGPQSGFIIGHEQIHSIGDCIPEAEKLEKAFFGTGRSDSNHPTEGFFIGNELRLATIEPEHFRHNPTSLINSSSGAWAIDMDIERAINHSPSSKPHRWRLPRRLRVTSAFLQPYPISQPTGALVAPRVSANGLLTLFTVANAALPKVTLPTDHSAIVYALKRGRDWAPFNGFREQSSIQQPCLRAERSDAGYYFWGVYQLFGDLKTACSVLLHKFWRDQLEAYGASDQRTEVRQKMMEKRLLRRIGEHSFAQLNTGQLRKLADIVLQEADAERLSNPCRKWTDFEADFKKLYACEDSENPLLREMPEALAKMAAESSIFSKIFLAIHLGMARK